MMRCSRTLAVAGVSAMLSTLAVAAPQGGVDALRQQALAASCTSCHGSQGHAVKGASVPGLAGLPAPYMVEQLKAFQAGTRQATVMHQLAKGYSDAQIEQLAAYFAAQLK